MSTVRRLAHSGEPLLRAHVVTAAVALTVLLAVPAPLPVLARLSWGASVLFSIGTLLAALATARRLAAGDPARRFWWALGANAVLVAAGYGVELVTAGAPGTRLVGPVTAALSGLGTATLVLVMLTYPLRIRSRRERLCFWLDMATVMVGAAAFGWYFTAESSARSGNGVLGLLAGPVVMLIAVFAAAKLLVAGRPPFSTSAGVLGALAAGVGAAVALLGPGALTAGHGRWVFALSAAGDAVLMVAAVVQNRLVHANPAALARSRRRPYSTLPYLAVAGTFGLLSIALTERGLDGRTWAVLAGAAGCTALVVGRQLAAFAENARLLAVLDAKVGELHEKESVLRAALHERDVLADRLHDMAFQDSLTGLANRALLHERLDRAQARARRHATQVVVMLLDLDDFKPINDQFGHATGDLVLVETARRLRQCLRETDTVARIGGDVFAILLDDPQLSSVSAVTERLVAAVRRPHLIDGTEVTVGVSVGVAFDRSGAYTADQLLDEADGAMYGAKHRGRSAPQVQAPADHVGADAGSG